MTNQKTTRAEYGYLGLQSIDIQETFWQGGGPFEHLGWCKSECNSFLKDPERGIGRGPLISITVFARSWESGFCSRSHWLATVTLDPSRRTWIELPFPLSLRAKLLLDHLERNREHRLEELMGSRPQCIVRVPSIQLLRPITPVPDRPIQIAHHERIAQKGYGLSVGLSCPLRGCSGWIPDKRLSVTSARSMEPGTVK